MGKTSISIITLHHFQLISYPKTHYCFFFFWPTLNIRMKLKAPVTMFSSTKHGRRTSFHVWVKNRNKLAGSKVETHRLKLFGGFSRHCCHWWSPLQIILSFGGDAMPSCVNGVIKTWKKSYLRELMHFQPARKLNEEPSIPFKSKF